MKQLRLYALCLCSLFVLSLHAQEPTFMEAATHPARGQLYGRALVEYIEYSNNGEDVEDSSGILKMAYGLRSDLAVLLDVNALNRSTETDDISGLSATTLRLKYRFLRKDLGPLDTWRASLMGGIELPGTDDRIADDHAAARLGIATTAILHRHGLNGEIDWTGREEDDHIEANASWLYRLTPARFSMETKGAWYSEIELLNSWQNTEHDRSDVAIGLLYEATTWAAEISAALPVAENGSEETDLHIRSGMRYLF